MIHDFLFTVADTYCLHIIAPILLVIMLDEVRAVLHNANNTLKAKERLFNTISDNLEKPNTANEAENVLHFNGRK